LQVKRAVADRQDVDNFVRADNRFGKRFFERNRPRLVYRDRYMVKRYRSTASLAAQRIIDADFRCVGTGDGEDGQQARQRNQYAPSERSRPRAAGKNNLDQLLSKSFRRYGTGEVFLGLITQRPAVE
jgi:hypothetical protein